jgi:hypothetical protein
MNSSRQADCWGALKYAILGLGFVAPDALVVLRCPDHVRAFLGRQQTVGKAGGEAFEVLIASASCSVCIKVYFFEGLLVPFVAFLHVQLKMLARGCLAQRGSFVS